MKAEDFTNLTEAICTLEIITCDQCGEEEIEYMFDVEALFNKGWRTKDKDTYCPECAKKLIP